MKPTRFLGFTLLPAILLLSCSSSPAPHGGSGGNAGGGGASTSSSTGAGGTCVGCITPDLRCLSGNSVDACGVSGAPCASCGRGNGTAACTNGACVEPVMCSGYYLDCDGDAANGCETPMTDPLNCGACGNVCDGGTCEESCVPGMGCSFACH